MSVHRLQEISSRLGARLRHYRRQAVRPVREHRYCPKFTPRHWAGRTHLGGLERAHGGFFGDSGGENTVYQNVLHEFDAESPDFGAVVESYSFFVGLRVVVLTKSGHVQRLVRHGITELRLFAERRVDGPMVRLKPHLWKSFVDTESLHQGIEGPR